MNTKPVNVHDKIDSIRQTVTDLLEQHEYSKEVLWYLNRAELMLYGATRISREELESK